MKKAITKATTLLALLAMSFCLVAQNDMQMFKSAVDAANKGKQDLLEVLKSGRDINLGVSAEQLQGATAGEPIAYQMLDFNATLEMSRVKNLSSIVKTDEPAKMFVPYMNNGKVVTVIEVAQRGEGWIVSGLGGAIITKQVNEVMAASGSKKIMIYEVPNLRAMVYTTGSGNDEMYYTNYLGGSLRQAVGKETLFNQLQADAKKFQDEFGDMVKEQRLVR